MDTDHTRLNKLFVGALPLETSEEELRAHFQKYGQIIDLIVIKDKESKKSRGFGFVTFKDKQPLLDVTSEKQRIREKTLDIKIAEPKKTSKMEENVNTSQIKKIFIGGIPKEVTPEILKQHFEQYGTVADIVLIEDKKTNEPRGFGFVTYRDTTSVRKALDDYSNHCLMGKWVECKLALPKHSLSSTNESSHDNSGYYGHYYQNSRFETQKSYNELSTPKSDHTPQHPKLQKEKSMRGNPSNYLPFPLEQSFPNYSGQPSPEYWKTSIQQIDEDYSINHRRFPAFSPSHSYYPPSFQTPTHKSYASYIGDVRGSSNISRINHIPVQSGFSNYHSGGNQTHLMRYGSNDSHLLANILPSPMNYNPSRQDHSHQSHNDMTRRHKDNTGKYSSSSKIKKEKSNFKIEAIHPQEGSHVQDSMNDNQTPKSRLRAPEMTVGGQKDYSLYQTVLKSERFVKSNFSRLMKEEDDDREEVPSKRKITKNYTYEDSPRIAEEVSGSEVEEDDQNGISEASKASMSKDTIKVAYSEGEEQQPSNKSVKLQQVQLNAFMLYGFKSSKTTEGEGREIKVAQNIQDLI